MMLRLFSSRLKQGIAVCVLTTSVVAQAEPLRANPDTCLVKMSNVAGANAAALPFGVEALNYSPGQRTGILRLTGAASNGKPRKSIDASTMKATCSQLKKAFPGLILSASPDYEVSLNVAPNDPSYSSLYGMKNINAPEAWDISTGSAEVVVGIIDTGIDYNHPDLQANIWTNPGEIAGNNIDDDNNGFVDDVHGYDFHNNDGDPLDDNGHGSHCAGTIGGVGNNGVGVAGVNWNVQMAGLKFLSGSGSGYLSNAVRAINYATQMGFNMTSNSWGGGGFSQVMYDAIKAAGDAGILFVAAAGNSGLNADVFPMYPAAYDLDNIISVAAVDSGDNLAYFSNYGATSVDIAAPGVGIYSTYKYGSYATLSGTSMATPHVSGVAALVLATHPGYGPSELKDAILNNADYVEDLDGFVLTSGRLNAHSAVLNGAVGGSPNPSNSFKITLESSGDVSKSSVGYVYPGVTSTLSVQILSATAVNVRVTAGNGNYVCNLGDVTDSNWERSFRLNKKSLYAFKRFDIEAVADGSYTKRIEVEAVKPQSVGKVKKLPKSKAFQKICSELGGNT